jgi:signal transduction histidine kinase
MLINQNDAESYMPPQESGAALLPDIKSAMLVPIMVEGNPEGIISIGEQRNWNRRSLEASDLVFARDVAGKCSLAIRLKRFEENRLSAPGANSPAPEELRSLIRRRLGDPLSSIIGAVELLNRQGADDQFSRRYHELILRSANRIKALADDTEVRDEEPVVAGAERYVG